MATATVLHKARYTPDLLARARIKITGVLFMVLLAAEWLLGFRPLNALDWSQPVVVIGVILLLAGLMLRSWAAGMLVKKKRLACDGPYALVRHPLYAGSILMMAGVCCLTGIWLNLGVAALLAFVSIGHAIRNEEAFLAAKFSDRWDAYAARTGRLVPCGVSGNLWASWDWRRWWRNREYNPSLAVLGVGLGLLAWRAYNGS